MQFTNRSEPHTRLELQFSLRRRGEAPNEEVTKAPATCHLNQNKGCERTKQMHPLPHQIVNCYSLTLFCLSFLCFFIAPHATRLLPSSHKFLEKVTKNSTAKPKQFALCHPMCELLSLMCGIWRFSLSREPFLHPLQDFLFCISTFFTASSFSQFFSQFFFSFSPSFSLSLPRLPPFSCLLEQSGLLRTVLSVEKGKVQK